MRPRYPTAGKTRGEKHSETNRRDPNVREKLQPGLPLIASSRRIPTPRIDDAVIIQFVLPNLAYTSEKRRDFCFCLLLSFFLFFLIFFTILDAIQNLAKSGIYLFLFFFLSSFFSFLFHLQVWMRCEISPEVRLGRISFLISIFLTFFLSYLLSVFLSFFLSIYIFFFSIYKCGCDSNGG